MTIDERTATEKAVVAAVLDYFDSWFDSDAARMERSTASRPGQASPRGGRPVAGRDAAWMVDATSRGVGRDRDPGDRQIDVTFEDIHAAIASATVRSAVYREYVHLARTSDGWKIVSTLWAPT